MNGKMLLLLLLVALGGIILGAVGMRYVGSWEGIAQAVGALRQPGSPTPVTTRVAVSQPTDQHAPDEHEGHTHEEPTSAQGTAPHVHHNDTHKHGADAHGHEAEKLVRLPAARAQQLGIEVAVARAGGLQTSLTLPGTIALNADRRVHVVSRIPGNAQEIRKQLGDAVRAGEVMAVIASRELADTKASYLAARERVTLAETTFRREKDL